LADSEERQADKVAEKINARRSLSSFKPRGDATLLPTDEALSCWLTVYGPTLEPSTRTLAEGVLRMHP
jgi:hypothetical protein